jgi:hypothetical protein
MSFSALADNQAVSFNSLSSGVSQGYFTAKTSIPSSSEITTKSDCNTYVNIDTTYLPFAEKTNNQIIVKEDLRSNQAFVYITNNFFTGTITDVTVNGVSITGASFPLNVGNSTTGYTNQIGTYDILVYYADADQPSNYMRIQDAAYNNQCIDGFSSSGPGPYYVYFASQVVAVNAVGITIESGDGYCVGPIPPPSLSSSPFSTVAVSRTTGQYMVAGSSQFLSSGYQNGGLYVSSNYGSSWTFVPVVGYWYKVAVSDDGSCMLAVEQYGKAYRSTNYGSTWSEITSLGISSFRGAAISGNGSQMLISINSASIDSIVKKSTDYGVSWTNVLTGSYYDNYNSCAIDSSGSNFYIGGAAGSPYVYRSVNQGSSWFLVYSTSNFSAFVSDINCTADGSKLVAPTFGQVNGLLKSSDYGTNWVTSATSNSWISASVNNNIPAPLNIPTSYVVAEGTGYLQKSEGTSAHTNTSAGVRAWRTVSNSNSGQYILAGAYNGLFLSTNYGSSFTSL